KSEVTGLLAKVRNAKRARELATALERIDRIIDKVNKRSALAKWNKTVKKKAKVKKVTFKDKQWFDVIAPKGFNYKPLGEIIGMENTIIDRTIEILLFDITDRYE
ncbi:MAG: hypothetical protein ACFFKA_22120, partial [Candidatus Thorarchaeota archaeon]